jgi:hypothetical protein
VEEERGFRLVDQGRDVADVDRLPQVDQFARLPQPVEELAEILFLFQDTPDRQGDVAGNLLAAGAGGNRFPVMPRPLSPQSCLGLTRASI